MFRRPCLILEFLAIFIAANLFVVDKRIVQTASAGKPSTGGTYRFDNVEVHRGYAFRSADKPKALFPTKDEVVKVRPGKLEIGVSTYWYTHKDVVTFDAPETVTEGQEITITGTVVSTLDLKEDAPSAEAYTKIRIANVQWDEQTLSRTLKVGIHTLKASKSVAVRVGRDQPFHTYEAKGVRWAKFTSETRSSLSNQLLLTTYWHYRADGTTPTPVGKEVEFAGPWRTSSGDEAFVASKQGNHYVGTITKNPPFLRDLGFKEGEQTFRGFARTGPNTFKGEISWRGFQGGKKWQEWRVHVATIKGDTLTFEPPLRVYHRGTGAIDKIAADPHKPPYDKLPDLPVRVRHEIEKLQQQAHLHNWSFQIGQTGVSHLSIRQLCSFRIPEGIDFGAFVNQVNQRGHQWLQADRRTRDEFNRLHPNVLTEMKIEARTQEQVYARKSRFDWRDYKKVTPVRDQGTCGSCWDFAAVGAFECSHLIRNNDTIRGSEQQILDCMGKGDCHGGWHMDAFDYLINRGGCGGQAYPYISTKGTSCKNVSSPYRAASWGFVAADGRMPSVDAMKQALCRHGPLAVVVHATPAFQHYTGGVFNENSPGRPDDTHVVLIVGWDDNKGKNGCWAVRNSWTTNWGEQGYMWIEYGCNGIGDHAAWVEAQCSQYSVMTLLMNDFRVKQGQNVYAPVHLLNPHEVNNMDWVVNYDSSVAKLLEPSVLDGNIPLLAFRANPFQANRVLLGFAEHKPINAAGQLARLHFKAVGSPGSRTPLTLEVKTISDPKLQHPPIKLVHGSIEIVKEEQQRLRGSCCGQPRLILEDAICALEMSVELRPTDLIMDMDSNGTVNSDDAAIIVRRVMGETRTGQ